MSFDPPHRRVAAHFMVKIYHLRRALPPAAERRGFGRENAGFGDCVFRSTPYDCNKFVAE
jgi:hypothetical protein